MSKKKSAKVSKKSKKTDSYHHGQLKEACVNAGLQLIAEKGDDFSLRDIARSLGVSHGAPYNHFSSKEDLLASIAQQGFVKFGEALKDAHASSRDDNELFRSMGMAYVRFGTENPHHYRLMFGHNVPDHHNYPDLAQSGSGCFQQLLDMVEELKKKKIFKEVPTMSAAILIWSSMHGYVSLLNEKRTPPNHDLNFNEFFDDLSEMLLTGLGLPS